MLTLKLVILITFFVKYFKNKILSKLSININKFDVFTKNELNNDNVIDDKIYIINWLFYEIFLKIKQ